MIVLAEMVHVFLLHKYVLVHNVTLVIINNIVQMANGLVAFVNAVAENYPVLQANAQYVALTDELSGTQNRITTARGRYIEAIQQYNIAVRRFPSNILAGIFGFTAKDYYQADVASMTTPGLGTGQLPQ